MSGSSCATTGSPIVSSGPTTTSLSTVATPGTNSSISLGPSCRSACATGPTGSDQRDLVLAYMSPPRFAQRQARTALHAGSDYPAWLKRVKHAISRAAAAGSVKGPEEVADFAHRLLTCRPPAIRLRYFFGGVR